jgi:hypothetical protein
MNSLELATLQSDLVKISEAFGKQQDIIRLNLRKIALTVESLSNINFTVKRKGGYVNEKISSPLTLLPFDYYIGKRGKVILVFNSPMYPNVVPEMKLEEVYNKIKKEDADVLLDRLYDLMVDAIEEDCAWGQESSEEVRLKKRNKNPKYGSW